jgi:hypothetical protein
MRRFDRSHADVHQKAHTAAGMPDAPQGGRAIRRALSRVQAATQALWGAYDRYDRWLDHNPPCPRPGAALINGTSGNASNRAGFRPRLSIGPMPGKRSVS